MTKHEKLILLLIALVLLGKFSVLARDMYLAQSYGATIPPQVVYYWEKISVLFGVFVNIGAAIWLYIEARDAALKGWIWSLLGLSFGLMGVILFYAIHIYSTKRNNET